MARLQLALDGTLADSQRILAAVGSLVDIVEIGTPLIYREGIHAAHALRPYAPSQSLLADLKIMDAGEYEAYIAFEAGCDWVTIMGVAHDDTIRGALAAAHQTGKQVAIDLIEVANPLERARHLLAMGAHLLCVHTGTDRQQHDSPLTVLRLLREALPDAPLAAAGGIKLATLDAVLAFRPEVVVVGSAITVAPDPAAAARALREKLEHDR